MAIQVNGTTVIDDSRNLSNVGGLKTVGGNSILGSGDIATGGSTTAGDVGTYAFLRQDGRDKAQIIFGGTLAGSLLYPTSLNIYQSNGPYYGITGYSPTAVSGTWRCMGFYDSNTSKNDEPLTVWLRIS